MAKKGQRQALTVTRIERATCSQDQKQVRLWDSVQPGLLVRIYPSGSKVYWARWRQHGKVRWDRIGDVDAISLDDARKATAIKLGSVAKGGDPVKERQDAQKQIRRRLGAALDEYEESLELRGVVKRREYLSLLRRELFSRLGDIDLAEIELEDIVRRIEAIKARRPGTAKELRTRASVFFNWCAASGLVAVSPLAGYRQPRRTRKQLLEEQHIQAQARALDDSELPVFWMAAEAQKWPFGPYLQCVLLTGQRRTETALMKWRDLDLDTAIWTIPAAETKSGREHAVPLPAQLIAILGTLPRLRSVPYVFAGRKGAVLSGWSKRLRPVYDITKQAGMPHWTIHDLRRTMRTGMTALGVENDIAEMLLNHQIGDDLRRIYDKHEFQEKRREAANMWAAHVFGLVDEERDNVVPLRGV